MIQDGDGVDVVEAWVGHEARVSLNRSHDTLRRHNVRSFIDVLRLSTKLNEAWPIDFSLLNSPLIKVLAIHLVCQLPGHCCRSR